jgi:hypothetical protein
MRRKRNNHSESNENGSYNDQEQNRSTYLISLSYLIVGDIARLCISGNLLSPFGQFLQLQYAAGEITYDIRGPKATTHGTPAILIRKMPTELRNDKPRKGDVLERIVQGHTPRHYLAQLVNTLIVPPSTPATGTDSFNGRR